MTQPLTLPALHASHAGSWICGSDGSVREIAKGEAVMAAADTPLLILNAPLVATRLGYPDLSGLDLAGAVKAAAVALAGPDRTLEAGDLEAAVLDRRDEGRCFRRLEHDDIVGLLS